MTVLRFGTPWLATAVLLVGLGSDLGAKDRAAASDDPTTRLESVLLGSSQDEPVGDSPDVPGLPQDGRGTTGLGALTLVGFVATHRGSLDQRAASSTRGPPGEVGPFVSALPPRPSSTTFRSPRPTPGAWAVVRPRAVHAA